MSVTHVVECTKCGKVEELWFPSFESADSRLAEWRCMECGCPKYTKKPQPTTWMFGPILKGK